jgi:hypothetical protein
MDGDLIQTNFVFNATTTAGVQMDVKVLSPLACPRTDVVFFPKLDANSEVLRISHNAPDLSMRIHPYDVDALPISRTTMLGLSAMWTGPDSEVVNRLVESKTDLDLWRRETRVLDVDTSVPIWTFVYNASVSMDLRSLPGKYNLVLSYNYSRDGLNMGPLREMCYLRTVSVLVSCAEGWASSAELGEPCQPPLANDDNAKGRGIAIGVGIACAALVLAGSCTTVGLRLARRSREKQRSIEREKVFQHLRKRFDAGQSLFSSERVNQRPSLRTDSSFTMLSKKLSSLTFASMRGVVRSARVSQVDAKNTFGDLPLHSVVCNVTTASLPLFDEVLAAMPSAAAIADERGNLPLHLALVADLKIECLYHVVRSLLHLYPKAVLVRNEAYKLPNQLAFEHLMLGIRTPATAKQLMIQVIAMLSIPVDCHGQAENWIFIVEQGPAPPRSLRSLAGDSVVARTISGPKTDILNLKGSLNRMRQLRRASISALSLSSHESAGGADDLNAIIEQTISLAAKQDITV